MAQIANNTFPSSQEIRLFAQVEELCEQHPHRLVQPLRVTVTDATGQVTGYEYFPETNEDPNVFRISASPEAPRFCPPVILQITDATGTSIAGGRTKLDL